MNKFLVLFFHIALFSCGNRHAAEDFNHERTVNIRTIAIADLPKLMGLKSVYHSHVEGKFEIFYSDHKEGIYRSVFIAKNEHDTTLIRYTSNREASKSDTLEIGKKYVALTKSEKVDPLSLQVYTLAKGNQRWMLFLGQSPSASGSGSRRTFYILVAENNYNVEYLLNSFFGTTANIGFCDTSQSLVFVKLTNSDDVVDNYQIELLEIGDTTNLYIENFELTYEMNDSLSFSGALPQICPLITQKE